MGKDLNGKKLGNGITQRKDGRYCMRQIYKGEKIERYNPSLKDLKKQVAEDKARIDANADREKNYTLEEWFNEWFDLYKVPAISENSVAPMKNKVKNTFLRLIGNDPLSDLRSKDVQQALKDLLEENKYAKGSISEALNRLKECLASAVNNKIIDINPAFDIVVPYAEERVADRRWLTLPEIPKFLEAAKGGWWYEMIYVMIYTGLRVGEVGGLKVSDIHWSKNGKRGYIEVNQSLTARYEKGVKTLKFGTLKTFNSHRRIPFLKDVEACLRVQIDKVNALKQSLGPRYRGTGEFADSVFVTNMGSPCTRYNAQRALNALVKTINIEESLQAAREGREPILMGHLYPHALRHTFASLCYKAQIDPKVTQSLMGHANYSTTIDIYTHFSETEMELDLTKFDQFDIMENTEVDTLQEDISTSINSVS